VRLILWDVDGTLVTTAGHGRDAFADAFEDVFGRRPAEELVPMSGKTDHVIAVELLESEGVPDAEAHVPQMFDRLNVALAARGERIAAEGSAMPGTHDAIAAIDAHEDVVQSLLTGNIEPNAQVKLAPFGLDRLLDLEIGAYATDHAVRAELVAVARAKAAAKHGVEVAAADTVLIGDTPLDVAAAHASGARAVGVATGFYSAPELEDACADAVLDDLTDTGAVLAAVGLAAGGAQADR
jgi:phosphoglycolate phosphatase-like HAD superfamily hydrolase